MPAFSSRGKAGCRRLLATRTQSSIAHRITSTRTTISASPWASSIKCFRGSQTLLEAHAGELRPDYPEACFNLANLIWKSDGATGEREVETIELLRRAVQLRPGLIEARYKLGTVLNECRRFEEAATALHEAFELSVPGSQPGDPTAPLPFAAVSSNPVLPLTASICNQLGVAYCALLRHQEIRVGLSGEPSACDPFAEPTIGNCYQEQARLPEAIASYEHSVTLNPNLPITRLNLAMAHIAKRRSGQWLARI